MPKITTAYRRLTQGRKTTTTIAVRSPAIRAPVACPHAQPSPVMLSRSGVCGYVIRLSLTAGLTPVPESRLVIPILP